ncbi:Ppx/GppA family phosphatase [uncultured Psychrosphaera sp.]|uniref:Ppx/GppA family phosphatase n=1 Tax=uncultured Psychrosphaera sp. TaxID=1403522 RepID=UPI0030FAEF74
MNISPLKNNLSNTHNHVAVLDIGSNSFHLTIVQINNKKLNIIHKSKYKVGLADGLVNTGLINPDAFSLGLETLKKVKVVLEHYPIKTVRVIATQALRCANNTNDFISQAQNVFPYPIEVIQGKEEARLIYKGVISQVYSEQVQLVIDIGGGSSEFVIGHGLEPKLLTSLNIGCVSFTNQFFADGQVSLENFNNAIQAASTEIKNIAQTYKQLGWETCLGTSGSIESIFSVIEMMDKNKLVTLHNLETLMSQIIEFKSIDALQLGDINKERQHVFPAGLAILIAMFRTLTITQMQYSHADLGQGVAFEIIEKQD